MNEAFLQIKPEPEWMRRAKCREPEYDPDWWFPSRPEGGKTAKAICRTCVVRHDCLKYALNQREDSGVWGGLGELERRRLRKGMPLPARVCEHALCSRSFYPSRHDQLYCNPQCASNAATSRYRQRCRYDSGEGVA